MIQPSSDLHATTMAIAYQIIENVSSPADRTAIEQARLLREVYEIILAVGKNQDPYA